MIVSVATNLGPAQTLLAQTPHAPSDSVPSDSGTVRYIHPPWPLLIILAIAPPLLVDWLAGETDPGRVGLPTFRPVHASAHITGGPALADSSGPTWAYSANVEVGVKHVYVEARMENFRLPQYVRFSTIRAGYLVQAEPSLAAGVTLGYREAYGAAVGNGVEIGLPMVYGWGRGWTRFEPTYVLTTRGVDWSYRFQIEMPLAGGPIYGGFNMEAKAVRLSRGGKMGSFSPVALLGVRY